MRPDTAGDGFDRGGLPALDSALLNVVSILTTRSRPGTCPAVTPRERRAMAPETAMEPQEPAVSTEDFQAALGDMTTYIDITADDLYTLYILARRHARARLRTQQAVREIMTTAVVTVDPDADLHDVAGCSRNIESAGCQSLTRRATCWGLSPRRICSRWRGCRGATRSSTSSGTSWVSRCRSRRGGRPPVM